jgi:hypothetical protein
VRFWSPQHFSGFLFKSRIIAGREFLEIEERKNQQEEKTTETRGEQFNEIATKTLLYRAHIEPDGGANQCAERL